MININVVNKNIMETVQTSVNIITLYPWSFVERRREGKTNSIVWCFVLVVCITYIHFSFFSNIKQRKKLRFLGAAVRATQHTRTAFSKSTLWLYGEARTREAEWKKLCRKIYDVGVVFMFSFSFHMLPHLRHMFFVVFARNIIFHSALSLYVRSSSRWLCRFSLFASCSFQH